MYVTIYYTFIPPRKVKDKKKLNELHHKIGLILRNRIGHYGSINISHSNDLIVCIQSSIQVGIDIEYLSSICLNHFSRNIFPEFIWNSINNNSEAEYIFFKFWTKLESVLKASRYGFTIPLEQVIWDKKLEYIEILEKKWYIKSFVFKNRYFCSIAGGKPIYGIYLKKIDFIEIERDLIKN